MQPNLDRRQFLRLNTAALAGAALAPAVSAETRLDTEGSIGDIPENVSPGFYRFAFGDMEITVLNDGHFDFPMGLIATDDPVEAQAYNADPETREEYFRSRRLPTDRIPLQTSPVVIDSGNRRTLVDSGFGAGEESPPTAGRLGPSLEAAGIAPESINQVLLTHGHPDHLGGLLDPASGTPLYPEAEVVISEKEHTFWMGEDSVSTLESDLAASLAAGARTVLEGLDDRIHIVQGEEEITGGIWSIPSPGHTPGHVCFAVEAGSKQLLLTGDAIVWTNTSFEHPEWHAFIDVDRDEAVQSRKRLLDRATTDEMFILGFHFPFPGLGYALEYGDAYWWQPAGAF